MIYEIQFNVDQALAKLEALVEKHGPDAVNLATQVVQMNAIGNAASSVACLALGGLTLGLAYSCFRAVKAETDKGYSDQNELVGVCGILVGGVSAVATVFFLGAFVVQLLDVWIWVGIFNPKLALAHEIMQRIVR